MITTCCICGCDFEIDGDIFFAEEDINDEWVCDECCDMIRNWIINRN